MKCIYASVIALFSLGLLGLSKGEQTNTSIKKSASANRALVTCPAWHTPVGDSQHLEIVVSGDTITECTENLNDEVADAIYEFESTCLLNGDAAVAVEGNNQLPERTGDTWLCSGTRSLLCCLKSAEPWPDPLF